MPMPLFLASRETFRLDCFFNLNLDKKYSGININLEGVLGVIPYVS